MPKKLRHNNMHVPLVIVYWAVRLRMLGVMRNPCTDIIFFAPNYVTAFVL